MSSVYILLVGVTWKKSSLDQNWGIGSSSKLGGGGFGLVDLTPWCCWTRYPVIVAWAEGKYLVALVRVSPGHNE